MSIQSGIELMKDPSRFSRLVILLLEAEYGPDYQAVDDDRGDGGNDGYIFSQKRLFARHCFKKLPKKFLDEEILKKIKSDFAKAAKLKKDKIFEIENWTFLSSYAVSNDVIVAAQKLGKSVGINVSLKGPAYIATLAAKHRGLLSEFPELQQSQILEEMRQQFDSIRAQIPKEMSTETKLMHELQEYFIQLLSSLALYKNHEVGPYYHAVNDLLVKAHKLFEDKLSAVEQIFGSQSNFYKELESFSMALKKPGQVRMAVGPASHNERMKLIESVYLQLESLARKTAKEVPIEDLEPTDLALIRSSTRWLDGIDDTFNELFDQAEEFAGRFSKVYALHYCAQDIENPDRYLTIAKSIVDLSDKTQSGMHDELVGGIKDLKQRIGTLDLSEPEAAILIAATNSEGLIHRVTTMQTPQGFVIVGDKSFASDGDVRYALKYVEALENLISKGIVQHQRGMLYSLTSAGWSRVHINKEVA